MNPLILALSTILSLGVDLYRTQPSSATMAPAEQQDEAPRAYASHVRRPAAASTRLEDARTEAFDPCYGHSPVRGVVSEQDGSIHTCYCTAVTGLQGEIAKYDVACF